MNKTTLTVAESQQRVREEVLWTEIERLDSDNTDLLEESTELRKMLEKQTSTAISLIALVRKVTSSVTQAREDYQNDWDTGNAIRDAQDAAFAFDNIINMINRELEEVEVGRL